MSAPLRLAVLLSGTGRTFEHLLDCCRSGALDAEIVGVVASRGDVAGVAKARAAGIDTVVLRRSDDSDAAAYGTRIAGQLRAWNAGLAAMAGFLKLWLPPPDLAGRVMNIHPSLLPAFGGPGMHGRHVHEAVLAAGVKVSGCTVHFADERYDTGPIIVQRCVPVAEGDDPDSLAARVFEQECRAYPEAIALFAQGRLALDGRRVRIR